MNTPTLFDFDAPIRRPAWGSVRCHLCGTQLRRYLHQDPATGWYQWNLDHTAYPHFRAHQAGRALLTVYPWSIGAARAVHITQATA